MKMEAFNLFIHAYCTCTCIQVCMYMYNYAIRVHTCTWNYQRSTTFKTQTWPRCYFTSHLVHMYTYSKCAVAYTYMYLQYKCKNEFVPNGCECCTEGQHAIHACTCTLVIWEAVLVLEMHGHANPWWFRNWCGLPEVVPESRLVYLWSFGMFALLWYYTAGLLHNIM